MPHEDIPPPVSLLLDDDTGSCLHSPGGQINMSLHSCREETGKFSPETSKNI